MIFENGLIYPHNEKLATPHLGLDATNTPLRMCILSVSTVPTAPQPLGIPQSKMAGRTS